MNEFSGKELSVAGTGGMTIRLGSCHEGVCLFLYKLPINSEKELEKLISALEWAKKRGPQIMALLKQV